MDLSDPYGKHSNFGKKLLIFLAVLIVLALIAGGGYWLYNNHKKTTTKTVTRTTVSVNRVSIPSPTQSYSSDNLSLEFSYPKNWVVVDTTGTNQLTVTSPGTTLVNSSGQTTTGKIIFTINNSNPTTLSQFASGDGLAVLPSQQISYTNPTPDQKASTYISFVHYDNSATPSGSIDGVYVTGNSGYKVNQDVPQSDILAVSPIVYYSFVSCSDSTCSATKPMSIPKSLWAEKSFSGPLVSMIESLAIN